MFSPIVLAQTVKNKKSKFLEKSIFPEKQAGFDWAVPRENIPLQLFSERKNLTKITFGVDNRDDKKTSFVPQLGSQEREGNFKFQSDYRQKNTYAWGKSSYAYRKIGNIRYNETNDFEDLYPFVMGDTARTIPLQQHLYTFQAGTVQNLSNWLLAVSADYRSTLSFRIQDPRPRNLSTSLEGKIGLGYKWTHYAAGFSASIGRYKQNNDVAFLSEVGHSSEYHFMGLGSDYYRFRGDNTHIFYNGKRFSLAIGLTPSCSASSGLYIHSNWSLLTTQRIIRDLNNLPLTTLNLHKLHHQIGYFGQKGEYSLRWGVELYSREIFRLGSIHIFGSSVGGIYPQIKTENSYTQTTIHSGVKAFIRSPYPIQKGFQWGGSLDFGGKLFQEYQAPQGKACFQYFTIALSPSILYHLGRGQLFAKTLARIDFAHRQLAFQLAKQVEPIQEYQKLLVQGFRTATSPQYLTNFSIGGSYCITSHYSLLFSLDYIYRYTSFAQQSSLSCYFGLAF